MKPHCFRLRIATDGRVKGVWDDALGLHNIGQLRIRRASHVEFCRKRQRWYVRRAAPGAMFRRIVQSLTRLPCGEVLHWAAPRQAALEWEREHFAPGGSGWRPTSRT